MKTLDIHNTGGSGPFGNSSYAERVTGCLEYQRLKRLHPQACGDVYKPTPTGKPNNLLIGSMVHAYAETELKEGIDQDEWINFVDSVCEWDPPKDAQDEAYRIYWAWRVLRKPFGEIIAVERILDVEIVPGLRVQAKVDLIERQEDSALCLVDFKTSEKDVDTYTQGRTRLQLQLYTLAAWALGIDIQRIEVRQIVKTKEVKERIYPIDLPTPSRERWIARYLQGALAREAAGSFGPRGGECDYCTFQRQGLCEL